MTSSALHDAQPRSRRWDWLGAIAGLALGAFDALCLVWLGADLRLLGHDVTVPFLSFFAATFGVLGFVVGRLLQARERERRDAEVIAHQLRALAESQRVRMQNEKLVALGRAATAIAHEVRNPLGVIRASASFAQERLPEGDEARRACEFIRQEIDRLNGVIGALLNFARPAEPRWQSVRVEALLSHAQRLAGPELAQRGVEARVEPSGPLPEVEACPDLLAQALLDLVVNAAQAMEGSGSGAIVLRASAAADSVALEVADAGPGIPPEHRDQIFEPFFTTRARGTGLGLAVSARIVEMLGGTLALADGMGTGPGGRGACFRITLPQRRRA